MEKLIWDGSGCAGAGGNQGVRSAGAIGTMTCVVTIRMGVETQDQWKSRAGIDVCTGVDHAKANKL
ncbi:hypothetical protein EAF00_012010 [Botryotinia globosa]|nr:hypothetical protein EAF00_012010 [Botryotinia globosa]